MASSLARVYKGDKLRQREIEVLTLIAQGKSTKQIAADLKIVFKTADSHRTMMMKKLGLHDVAGVTRYAIKHGHVSVDYNPDYKPEENNA